MSRFDQRSLLRFCLGVLCIFLTVRGHSQGIDKEFLDSSVFVHYQTDPTHENRGSGFVIFHEVSFDPIAKLHRFQLVLVTNKHMLPPEHGSYPSMSLRMAIREEGQVLIKDISVQVLNKQGAYLPSIALHPDPKVDVAAVNISADLEKSHSQLLSHILEKHEALTTDLLIAKDDLGQAAIGIGTQIYLLGYPAGVYDPRNAEPILRIGVIATDPENGYSFDPVSTAQYGLPSPIPGFLIDANVYPGSSGSMVIRRTNIVPGFTTGGKQSTPYILGIVADSIPINDLWGTTRMGLGIVFGADTISETIKRLPAN